MCGVRRGLGAIVLVCAWALPAAHAHAQSPRAKITSGPPAETSEARAAFAFDATSPAPLSGFECRLDAGPWQACQSPLTIEALTGGPHRFEVRLTCPLTDPSPAEWRWTVTLQTSVDPPLEPLPPPEADPPGPSPPAPPRDLRRRDAFGCAYAANRPREVRDARLERATVCAINRLRTRRGLHPVRQHPRLQRAASGHAADMVRRRYFSHQSPEGLSSYDRIRRAGYLRGAAYWTLAEDLAWETGPGPSPADTVRAWMRSPGHRRALLLASVREIGVALVHGTPMGSRGGATWAANLGRRGLAKPH